MATPTEPPSAPVRVVVFLHRWSYFRFFEAALDALLQRGHELIFLIDRDLEEEYQGEWVRRMELHPRCKWVKARGFRRDPLRRLRGTLRLAADYLRFLRPRFERAPWLSERAAGRSPSWLVRLIRTRPLRSARARRLLGGLLESLDHALPAPYALVVELDRLDPDLVVVSPHGMPGVRDSDYLKAANALRVPSAVAVASWDNLSSKQLLHEQPQRLLVWNETQKREAIELHGVAEERVVVTGAQNFDLWFEWEPGERGAFCKRVGLDPGRPYVLYLGGALYRAELTEAEWARRWVAALRESGDPSLAEVGVLLRPHPRRAAEWLMVSFEDQGDVAVWPREAAGKLPLSAETRADFYDSIYHSAAVVGLNTSAMIEAAIVGRSVHTLIVPEFAASQEHLVHFEYLLSVGGGLPRTARSLAEHTAQLAETLRGGDVGAEERRRRFLEAFIRPHGLDRPATPIFVETLEQLAHTPFARDRRPLPSAVARSLLALALWLPDTGYLLARALPHRSRHAYRLLRRDARRAWRRTRKFGRRCVAAVRIRTRPFVRWLRVSRRHLRKRLRRRFLVWLPALVRVRRQRLRAALGRPEPSDVRVPTLAASAGHVCHCRRVEYGTVEAAIAAGARTVADVQRATTACTRCFGCRSELERMLRDRLGSAFRHEATVTLPEEFVHTKPTRPMYMPVLAGFRGFEIGTRVIAFNSEGREAPVQVRADLLRPDGRRVRVWQLEVRDGCSAVLDLDRDTVGSLLPDGVGVLKLVFDTDEIGSLRPYFQFRTPTCITSTHEKSARSKRNRSNGRPYHWIFPVGVGERDEEAYFFCTNVELDPMAGQLVWTPDGGESAAAPFPTLELDQTACVPLHEHFDDVRTGARGGAVRLTPATHVVAGFMIRHDRERRLWRVQHL